MGTYNKGILGAFSGKVGTVVGANWRGKDVMRSLPKKTGRIATDKQEMQRLRFRTVANFLHDLRPVMGRYYGIAMGDKSKNNLATSYHMKEALVQIDDSVEILLNRVQITRGVLLGLQTPAVAAEAGGILKFSWTDNSGQGTAKATDRLLVAVYDPITDKFETMEKAGLRSALSASVTLPAPFVGSQVHCWASFVSEDDKLYSTSVYLGEIEAV